MQISGIQLPLIDAGVRHLEKQPTLPSSLRQESPLELSESQADQEPALREAFHEFVGQTFFTELIKSYRSTQQPSEYFHGGRAEEIFQGQLDQVLADALSQRTSHTIADPMFELFMAKRS